MSGTIQKAGAAASDAPPAKPERDEDIVSLYVSGVQEEFVGWKAVRITRRLLGCPSDFDLELTEIYPTRSYLIYPQAGQACQVKINGQVVIDGYIDRYNASISPHGHTVRVQGRSKCQDVVDCSITPDQLNGMTITVSSLLDLGNALCKPYGVTVKSLTGNNVPVSFDGTPGKPISFAANLQETPYEIMEQVARAAAVLIYDDLDGNLLLAPVGVDKMQSGFIEGDNVQEASVTYGMDQRYSVYFPCTQNVNNFGGPAGYGGRSFPVVRDFGVPRFRQRVVVTEQSTMLNGSLAEQRAKWEASRRYGHSQAIRLVTDTWRDKGDDKGNGRKLWAINAYAPLWLPSLHMSPAEPWIIGEVTYAVDTERGTTASLLLMPKEAFLPEPNILVPYLWDPGRKPPEEPPAAAAAATPNGTGTSTGTGTNSNDGTVSVGGALTEGPNGTRIYPDGTVLAADGSKTASDGFLIRGPDTIAADGTRTHAPVNTRP